MRKLLTVLMMLASMAMSHVQAGENVTFPGKKSEWNGGVRYDFTFRGKDAIMVVPENPAPGCPWIFRPAFFDAFAWVDAALLKEGFHVVYCDFTHEFACPQSMKDGLAFYKYMVRRHGLSRKVTLEGFSRGAYWCYNWAARHPRKVACLYVDAPLCHMITGPNSDNDDFFQDFLRKWGMEKGTVVTEDFKANTKRLLPKLAKGKIPILGVCGDSDRIVPYEENLLPLSQEYKALGGEIELIVKPGCDHHPHSLEQPAPIVKFILEHQPQ